MAVRLCCRGALREIQREDLCSCRGCVCVCVCVCACASAVRVRVGCVCLVCGIRVSERVSVCAYVCVSGWHVYVWVCGVRVLGACVRKCCVWDVCGMRVWGMCGCVGCVRARVAM